MWGVVKGFQIACNLAGKLGDLTGRGDQPSGKVVHRNLAEPLGDLTGTGDQASGKVVLVTRRQSARNQKNKRRTLRGILKLVKTGIVKIHITL